MRLTRAHMMILGSLSFVLLLGYLTPSFARPWAAFTNGAGDVQPSLARYSPDPERAAAVKDVFQWTWQKYYSSAFPHDSLRPKDSSYEDDRLVSQASSDPIVSTNGLLLETDGEQR